MAGFMIKMCVTSKRTNSYTSKVAFIINCCRLFALTTSIVCNQYIYIPTSPLDFDISNFRCTSDSIYHLIIYIFKSTITIFLLHAISYHFFLEWLP